MIACVNYCPINFVSYQFFDFVPWRRISFIWYYYVKIGSKTELIQRKKSS